MNKEEIIQKIRDSYNIDIVRMEILRYGPDNVMWDAMSNEDDRYVIRISKRDMGNDIMFEAEWLCILQNEGVPVVSIILTKKEKPYVSIKNNQTITVFNFLDGKHIDVSASNPLPEKAVKSAATALAMLHTVSKKHKISFSRKRTVFKELERTIEHQNFFLKKMPKRKEFIQEVKEILDWGKTQAFTPVLVHNDYRIGNIMFDESNNLLAILDFDWSCMGPAIKDVAHSLAEWSFPDKAEQHNEKIFSLFLEKYNQTSDTPINRNDLLYRWIALSCLSDASTFLTDSLLHGEIKQPSQSYMYKKYQYFLTIKE